MKTIGYKFKLTASVFSIVMLTSCTANVPVYSLIETNVYQCLIPIITKSAKKFVGDKISSATANKSIAKEIKEVNQIEEKPESSPKHKLSFLRFGTTEAFLTSTDKNDVKNGNSES